LKIGSVLILGHYLKIRMGLDECVISVDADDSNRAVVNCGTSFSRRGRERLTSISSQALKN